MLTPYSANSPKPESADSSDSNPLPSTQRQNRRKNYIFPLPSPYESRFPISIGRTPILVETHNMANTPSSSQNPTTPHPPALRPTKTPPLASPSTNPITKHHIANNTATQSHPPRQYIQSHSVNLSRTRRAARFCPSLLKPSNNCRKNRPKPSKSPANYLPGEASLTSPAQRPDGRFPLTSTGRTSNSVSLNAL